MSSFGKGAAVWFRTAPGRRPGSAGRRRGVSAGFTLIEVTLVVLIIGLLFGIAALKFDALTDGSRLGASAREIGSTVGVAYSQAVLAKQTQTLVFDTENQAYWIASETDPEGESGAGFLKKRGLYKGVTFKDVQVGAEVFEEKGLLRIDISPLGVSSSCMVHLVNESGSEMTVRVHPLTGTVSYYDEYVEYGADEEGGGFAD